MTRDKREGGKTVSEGSKSAKKIPGKVFWPLMAASAVVLGGYYAVIHIDAVLERLRFGPVPEAPVTDLSDVHPGEPPFGTSDFSSMEKGNDR